MSDLCLRIGLRWAWQGYLWMTLLSPLWLAGWLLDHWSELLDDSGRALKPWSKREIQRVWGRHYYHPWQVQLEGPP